MQVAQFFQTEADGTVLCRLCPHHCRIAPGERGRCGVRENQGGVLYSLVYGRPAALHCDPIEKKPLFHFLPGSSVLSLGTVGCNLACLHCQNASLAQGVVVGSGFGGDEITPAELVAAAQRRGCSAVAYTYNEPTVFFEYALDTSRQAAAVGLKNILVTNGYLERETLAAIAPVLDGANIDLKSFRDEFYRRVCGGRLAPVLQTIEAMVDRGIWVEVTTLIIPGYNDSREELAELAGYLAGVSRDLPWHLSAFFPTHRLTDAPPTPAALLQEARRIGQAAGLRFVYTGNLHGDVGEHTFCPGCGKMLIERIGFRVGEVRLQSGACPDCQRPIPGVWERLG